MQIDRVLYPITTLGPGKRLVIWTIGCPHHCANCSNPELWNPNLDKEIEIQYLTEYLEPYLIKCEGITITGGDPFYQGNELIKLIFEIKKICNVDILVYTGYSYAYVKRKYSKAISSIDVLVDGLYVDKLNNNIGLKGSSNQNVYIINPSFKEKYKDFNSLERQRQNFIVKDKIISVGIPQKA